MNARTGTTAVALASLVALAACGGAKSPGACPAGTVLKGSDCVADDSSGDDSSSGGGGGGGSKGDDSSGGSGSSGSTASGGGDTGGGSGGGAGGGYDKDAVEVALKRSARQIKSSCGAATDDQGQATGPWGTTKVTVTLGRNGHVKQVQVPSPYDGKPVGICIVHAFQRVVFPPYAGSADATLDWDVEIVQPKK